MTYNGGIKFSKPIIQLLKHKQAKSRFGQTFIKHVTWNIQ